MLGAADADITFLVFFTLVCWSRHRYFQELPRILLAIVSKVWSLQHFCILHFDHFPSLTSEEHLVSEYAFMAATKQLDVIRVFALLGHGSANVDVFSHC